MRLGFKDEPAFSWLDMVKSLWYLLSHFRKRYLIFTAILVLTNLYNLIPPYIIGKVIDFFTHYTPGSSLQPFYILVLILTVTKGGIALVRLSTKNELSKIQSQMNYFTRVKGFEKLLDFSLRWHDTENTGNKVQRIQNGTDALKNLSNLMGNGVIPLVTTIIGVLVAFLFVKPLLFFYCLIYLAIFIAIQWRYYQKSVEMNDEFNSLMENASGTYYEGLSNILTIKTLGVKSDFRKNITSKEELTRDYSIRMSKFGTDKWKWFQIVNAITLGGVLLIVGDGVILRTITLGAVTVFFNYFMNLSNSIGDSTGVFDQLVNIKVSLARMMPIFNETVVTSHGTKNFPKDWQTITLDHATFYYKKEQNERKREALNNICLTIHKHQKIGIVGRSGSGKSTLAKIILGLYPLNSGTYKIGATPFQDISSDEVTQVISLVLQDSEMFNLSFKENITLMREFNEDLFEQAIEIGQLESLIQKLPDGIETLIGEKGYRLSGGERQRIGIARAIYKDPQILILDEATSSLDSKTESLIQNGLEKKLQKKTIISIAHRVSTLEHVDRIFVFEDGKITEEGSFSELSKDTHSQFFDIYKRQKK